MDPELIKSLIAALAGSDLAELEYSHGGETLRLTKRVGAGSLAARPEAPQSAPSAVPAPAPSPAAPVPEKSEIQSPLYGVVHLRPTPDAPPFVTAGQAVSSGQTLCVIEAMKVFNEVRADRDFTLAAILVESGQEVDIGQPLFRVG